MLMWLSLLPGLWLHEEVLCPNILMWAVLPKSPRSWETKSIFSLQSFLSGYFVKNNKAYSNGHPTSVTQECPVMNHVWLCLHYQKMWAMTTLELEEVCKSSNWWIHKHGSLSPQDLFLKTSKEMKKGNKASRIWKEEGKHNEGVVYGCKL